ncbi:M24 family metallopeptidase [Nonlabens sp.]|uniref:M24 family metallopeptidase n=1 Tax=Nonlabens sp. TaxID=1888209 RepID=UPI001BCE8276|nr:M24 family metallopeptidase [Nonlabens sp.]
MTTTLKELQKAEEKAALLFQEIEKRQLIRAGRTEKEVNTDIFELAEKLFGIQKYWHKRIVRAGENTLHPYDENPPDLTIRKDDILFIDFGPIIEEWEADYGRTYVMGADPYKKQLAVDSERIWHKANEHFKNNPEITGAQLYEFCVELAARHDWEFGGPIAGHLIGYFPHEKLETEVKTNYIHPENHTPMNQIGADGALRHWIIEIHLVDSHKKIGSFFEQLAGF